LPSLCRRSWRTESSAVSMVTSKRRGGETVGFLSLSLSIPLGWVLGRHWKAVGSRHRMAGIIVHSKGGGDAMGFGSPFKSRLAEGQDGAMRQGLNGGYGGAPIELPMPRQWSPKIDKQPPSGLKSTFLCQGPRKESRRNRSLFVYNWFGNSVRIPVASQFQTGRRNSSCRSLGWKGITQLKGVRGK
jgi:hypothetical protein